MTTKKPEEYREEIVRIEVNFPVKVHFPDKAFQHLVNLVSALCNEWEKHHPGRVMWPASMGFKMLVNPLKLSDDESIPFDENTIEIACHERVDYKTKCAKCGMEQGDHKDHWYPDPPAGHCEFVLTNG